MYKECRQSAAPDSASTPSVWAENFASATTISVCTRLIFRLDHRWRLIRQFVGRGGRILDAGCGAGEWVAFLNENGYRAEGVDYSRELIGRVRAMYPGYAWEVGSIQQLPYADSTFDAVISWGVIEHDERGPAAAFREFNRVLRPGGVVIVTVPVDTPRQRRASQIQFPAEDQSAGRMMFFQYFMTVDELSQFAADAGFRVVHKGLQRSAAGTLLWPRLSTHLSVTARNNLNRIARLILWWHRGLRNMTYCIGRRD